MLKRLEVRNFKGFERFTMNFTTPTVLVGPNNAGKSTLITALRLASEMLRQGRRIRARHANESDDEPFMVHQFRSEQFDLQDENLRHEFRRVETSFDLKFDNGSSIHAVWPVPLDRSPYYFFRNPQGAVLEVARAVRDAFPSLGTIPPLSPLEHRESILRDPDYLRSNLSTRLASRHFRNQLLELRNTRQWQEFSDFCGAWIPEIVIDRPETQEVFGPSHESTVNVFYSEGHGPKEVVWAGDGLQVFLQLLLHLFRLQGSSTIVLDEPEVFLHADLQRRLVRCVMECTPQAIIATHSHEIVMEVDPASVVLVEKGRRSAQTGPEPTFLDDLTGALGTHFKLRAARAMKTDLALFVEGGDTKLLRIVAKNLGAIRVANEERMTVAPLGGVSNIRQLVGFEWLSEELLDGAIKGYVIVDRDALSNEERLELRDSLRGMGLSAHVWERREIESYLLAPEAIERISGAPAETVLAILENSLEEMKPAIEMAVAGDWIQRRKDPRLHPESVMKLAKSAVGETWTDYESKLTFAKAKLLRRGINQQLQENGHQPVTWRALALALEPEEVPGEMSTVLLQIEELLEEAARTFSRSVAAKRNQ